MSLVSIVTPAYNAERFVGAAIESVRAQTHPDLEMLVVDDVSTDATAAVVERHAAEDARVRLLRRAANGGPAASRNTALEAAAGRWIAFLDSDDAWLPDKLEAQLRFMESTGAPFTYTRYRRIDEEGEFLSGVVAVPDRLDYDDLLGNTAIVTSSVLIDRAATGDFRMRDVYYDDFACWLELLKRGHVAHGVQQDLTRYRVLARSWSRNKLRSAWKVWRTYRDIEQLGLPRSASAFVRYAANALRKQRV